MCVYSLSNKQNKYTYSAANTQVYAPRVWIAKIRDIYGWLYTQYIVVYARMALYYGW